MRKYVTAAMFGTALGLTRLAWRTTRGPRDTRLALSWIAWACAAAMTADTIRTRSRRAGRPQTKA